MLKPLDFLISISLIQAEKINVLLLLSIFNQQAEFKNLMVLQRIYYAVSHTYHHQQYLPIKSDEKRGNETVMNDLTNIFMNQALNTMFSNFERQWAKAKVTAEKADNLTFKFILSAINSLTHLKGNVQKQPGQYFNSKF